MKTAAIFLLMISLGLSNAFGQFTPGDKEYIGSVRFSVVDYSDDVSESTTLSFNITNRIGFVKKANLSFGAYLGYGFEDYECTGNKETTRNSNTYTGGLYLRRYFKVKRFVPFLEANLLYSHFDHKSTTNNSLITPTVTESSTNALALQVRTGLQFTVNDWFSIEGVFDPFFTTQFYRSDSQFNTTRTVASFDPDLTLSLSGLSVGARFKI